MSKVRSSLVALGLIFVTGMAFAMPPIGPMRAHRESGPMMMHHRFFLRPGVPMLLPLAEMHSYYLDLSDHQVSALAVWRNRHMREVVPLMKRIHQERLELRRDLLKGSDKSALHDITGHLNRDRAHMLNLEVSQVGFVHHVLSASQWQKLLTLRRRMWKRGFGLMHK
ncbi:MAG TPA: hypothetical protein VMV40_05390 [Acidiferrobacter sp.]|nr:hypothetical protein [Acidiferrobacter sp.]